MLKALTQVFLRVDFEANSKAKFGDSEIYIATQFDNTRKLRVSHGTVVSCPEYFAIENNIQPGDTLYCHYSFTEQLVEVNGETLCFISPNQVFFKLHDNGVIEPYNEYIICTPVLKKKNVIEVGGSTAEVQVMESGLYAPILNNEEIPLVADVIAVSKKVTRVKVGDRIRYSKNSDYDIYLNGYLNGQKYLKMRGHNYDIDFIYKFPEDVHDQRHR